MIAPPPQSPTTSPSTLANPVDFNGIDGLEVIAVPVPAA
jgi:hypothetical protein